MAEVSFTLDPASHRALVDAAQRTAAAFGSPRRLLSEMGAEVLTWIDETFDQGGRPAWEPLRPSTLAGRRQGSGAAFSSGSPLRDNGKLRTSFDEKVLTDSRVEIGSDNPVARFHQYGTKGPYEIKPRFAKALALPALVSGPDGGVIGQRSLKRAKSTGRGSFVLPGIKRFKTPLRPGQRTASGRLVEGAASRVAFNVRVPYKNVAFVRSVTHPGLPARPMLPTPEQIVPRLVELARLFVAEEIRR